MSSIPNLSRRQFLQLTAASSIAGLSACTPCHSGLNATEQLLVSGYRETDTQGNKLERFGVLLFAIDQRQNIRIISDFAVPHEVHLATLFPYQKSLLVCSRVAGACLLKYALDGTLLAKLEPLKNQHFEGHGIFSADEQHVYTTSSDYKNAQGRVLKLNAHDLSLVSDHSSGGLGPHELVWQSEQHIAIANTGVSTHPDSGRKILNPDSIHSNVSLFNTQTQAFEQVWPIPLNGLSARHLDRMSDGRLVIGCQYKKYDQRPPCVAFASRDHGLTFAAPDNDNLHWQMQGYSASTKAIPNSPQALISNPRGHLLTRWHQQPHASQKTRLLESTSMPYNKGISIAKDGQHAWISKGPGELTELSLETGKTRSLIVKENIWWGNHLG